jgi:hypothetical protein
MEAANISETLVLLYQNIRHNILRNHDLNPRLDFSSFLDLFTVKQPMRSAEKEEDCVWCT